MYVLASKFYFLEFWLLLSRVAPYYSSLPRTVWLKMFHWILLASEYKKNSWKELYIVSECLMREKILKN